MVWPRETLWWTLDTIRVIRENHYHFDPSRLLALFWHGQPEWHSMSLIISVCSCKPIPRICKHVMQKCINFVVILFKVEVSISIDMPRLHFMTMTWSYVNQFLMCSDIFNNMTNTEVSYPNFTALWHLVHCLSTSCGDLQAETTHLGWCVVMSGDYTW